MEALLKLEYNVKDAFSKLLNINVQFASMCCVKSATVSFIDLLNCPTTIENSLKQGINWRIVSQKTTLR